MSASVTNGNHNKTQLGKSVHPCHTCTPGTVNSLCLRSRIDILNNRINFGGIKIKWLVKNTIKVCNTICRLYSKELRVLVAVCQKGAQVCLLKLHYLTSRILIEGHLWSHICTGIGAYEIFGIIRHNNLCIIVALIQQFNTGAVKVCRVEVAIVRILILLPSVGGKIDNPSCLIHAHNSIHVEIALGYSVLNFSIRSIEIEMSPAVTLRPPDILLASINPAQLSCLHISIKPLLKENPATILINIYSADIHPLKVSALPLNNKHLIIS